MGVKARHAVAIRSKPNGALDSDAVVCDVGTACRAPTLSPATIPQLASLGMLQRLNTRAASDGRVEYFPVRSTFSFSL